MWFGTRGKERELFSAEKQEHCSVLWYLSCKITPPVLLEMQVNMACLVVNSKGGHLHCHRHDVHSAVHKAGLKLLVEIYKLLPSEREQS